MGRFKKAQRKRALLRFGIDGPAGSGKTYTALAFAHVLARLVGNPRIAVICSEDGRAELYKGIKDHTDPDGEPWDFDVDNLKTFAPTEYTAAIEEAGKDGYGVLVIDSLSHAWAGKDGALELKDKSGDKNSFTAWRTITPMHNRMIDAILQSPCHVIATMRSKVEHVLEDVTDDRGQTKKVPRRVGMAPIQRAGMEYEFDLYGSMDLSHMLTITKSRCPSASDAVVVKPGGNWIAPVAEWLMTGSDVDVHADARRSRISDEQLATIARLMVTARVPTERMEADLVKKYGVREAGSLRPEQADEVIAKLQAQERSEKKKAEQRTAAKETAKETTATTETTATAITPETKSKASDKQLASMKGLRQRLFDAGSLSENDWKQILERRGVTTARDLTPEQADQLNAALERRVQALGSSDADAGAHADESTPAEGVGGKK